MIKKAATDSNGCTKFLVGSHFMRSNELLVAEGIYSDATHNPDDPSKTPAPVSPAPRNLAIGLRDLRRLQLLTG